MTGHPANCVCQPCNCVCKGCGAVCGHPKVEGHRQSTPAHHPPISGCPNCPPRKCDQCGEMDSADSHCACWISVEDIPLADLKALFASSDLSIALPQEES